MADNKETDEKNNLNAKDIELWREMTRDVSRMEGRDYLELDEDLGVDIVDAVSPVTFVAPIEARPSIVRQPRAQGRGIDRRTMRRLERGDIQIESKIDLHGMNQGQARVALLEFIRRAYAQGQRCVLVITGKGNRGGGASALSEPGVLKKNTPVWLHEGDMAAIVLSVVSAQRKHGGDGAYYVYLRRQRPV